MNLFEAIQNKDQLFDADIGRKTQMAVAWAVALFLVWGAFSFGWGPIAGALAIWFALAGLWPAALGRIVVGFTLLSCAIVITLGAKSGGAAYWMDTILPLLPLILVAAILSSRQFAAATAITIVYGYRRLFAVLGD